MHRLTLAALLSVLVSACAIGGFPPPDEPVLVADAGPGAPPPPDSGASDAGMSDAGGSDAGTTDAGRSDGGASDAGGSDAGGSDASVEIADAGSPLSGCTFDAQGEVALPEVDVATLAPHGDGITAWGATWRLGGSALVHFSSESSFTERWRSSFAERLQLLGGRLGTDELLFASGGWTISGPFTAVDIDSRGERRVRGMLPDAFREKGLQLPDGQLRTVVELDGHPFVRQRDAHLSVVQEYPVTPTTSRQYWGPLDVTPDGGTVHAGREYGGTGSSSDDSITVVRMGADGGPRWSYTESIDVAGMPVDLRVLQTGDVVVVGRRAGSPGSAWAMRLDDTGAVVWSIVLPGTGWAYQVREVGAGRLLVLINSYLDRPTTPSERWMTVSDVVLLDAESGNVLSTDSIGSASADRSGRALAVWTDTLGTVRFAVGGSAYPSVAGRQFLYGFVHTGTCTSP